MYEVTCSDCGQEAEVPLNQMEPDLFIARNVI
ncbi:MAG: hypothetical protein ACXQTO_04735 [Candidatus Syntropharchaeales archaeon]